MVPYQFKTLSKTRFNYFRLSGTISTFLGYKIRKMDNTKIKPYPE
jgi:hypothetical protein